MTDIALIMNGLLGVLLVGVLLVGWRLEGRLKALRASHASFTEALGDLDRAAARAEQGLADLRTAADAAGEQLAARIERAGSLAGRLEKLTAEAATAERRLAAAPRPALSREAAIQRFSERFGAMRTAPANGHAQAAARNDLILEDAPMPAPPQLAPGSSDRLEQLRGLAHPGLDLARVARAGFGARPDDELFEAPEPRRAVGGFR